MKVGVDLWDVWLNVMVVEMGVDDVVDGVEEVVVGDLVWGR